MIVNNRFQVKTADGYRDFAGITESSHDSFYQMILSTGDIINCSGEHAFWTIDDMLIKTEDILVGFDLKTLNGIVEVKSITHIKEKTKMVDIIEVSTADHHFLLSNGVKTHNCQFLVFEKTLVDSDVLNFYLTKPLITELNGFNIYKEEVTHADGLLIITIDPSAGGDDNSVIQLWEIAPHSVIEVASFVDKFADASVIFEKLLWLQEYLKTKMNYEPDNALIIFERNGIGEGLAQILTQTEKAIEQLEFPLYYDERGKPGIHTTQSLKNKLALQFKNLLEFGKMQINDPALIDELYGFVRNTAGSYSAKSGYKDDRVSAAFLLVFYLMNVFSDFAMGEFSVDNMMLVEQKDKLTSKNKNEEVDPAVVYRNKQQEIENAAKEELRKLEEIKKREREYYNQLAARSSSSVIVEEEDDSIDYYSGSASASDDPDDWDMMPVVM